nr:DUF4167 domain-containing protein [Sphingomonas sp. Y57]
MINNRQNGRRRGRGGGSGAPRPNGSNGGQDRGNRIDNRARGNAAQLLEKYKALARDAQMQGDRVNTEYYLQFADHYFRVLSESRSRFEDQQPRPRRDDFAGPADEEYGDEGERIGSDEQQPAPARAAGQERGFHRRDRDRDAEPRRERETRDRDAEVEAPVAAQAPVDTDGEDEDRRPRRGRAPRAERRAEAPSTAPELPLAQAAAPEPAPAAEEPAPVRRRGRPPKAKPVEAAEQIEVDRLPPSLKLQAPVNGDEGEEAPRPRTRTRKPRGETAAA